jgi:ABC-type hemin transport system ATPase subunit
MDIAGCEPDDVFVSVIAAGGAIDVVVGPVRHSAGRAGEVGVLGGDVTDHKGDVDCGGQGLLDVLGGFA